MYAIRSYYELQQVGVTQYGATYPSKGLTPKSLLYSQYTADGYQVLSSQLPNTSKTYQPSPLPCESYLTLLTDEEATHKPDLSQAKGTEYASKNYSKWNLLNFHSWSPTYTSPTGDYSSLGLTLLSQNLLGTTFATLGYNRNNFV